MRTILSCLLIIITLPLFSQIISSTDTVSSEEFVFEKVEVEAAFPGGQREWARYLEKNLNPMVPIDNGAPIGNYTVIVQFIVDKKGMISDIKANTNFGYGMEKEVIRIIQKSPNWAPAVQLGRNVKAYRKQPVTFVVEDEDVQVIMKDKYVLYTGMDNMVQISVKKVKDEDLHLSIPNGTVIPLGSGIFKIKVNNPGKAILDIYNKKKEKSISQVYFIIMPKRKAG